MEDEVMERKTELGMQSRNTEIFNNVGNITIIEKEESSELISSCNISEESNDVERNNSKEIFEQSATNINEAIKNDIIDNDGKNQTTDKESCTSSGGYVGSEEEFSNPCQPCLENDRNVDSLLYCVECEDFLCAKCVEMHKKVKPSRTHKLVSKNVLNNCKDEMKINRKEACPFHISEYIEWLCLTDDKLCCNICKTTEHSKCRNIVTIASVAETTNMQPIEEKIAETQIQLKNSIENREVNIISLDEDRNDSLQVLEKIKADTEDTFQRLMQSLEKETQSVQEIYKKEKDRLMSDIEDNSRIIKGLNTTLTWLRKENICIDYKYIQMKKAENHLQSLQATILNRPFETFSTPIGYERDKQYDVHLAAFKKFGYFDSEKRMYVCSEPRTIRITKELEKLATLFDICVVEQDKILITDWFNSCVKLVDTENGKILDSLQTSSNPFGICQLNEKAFAVTITSSQKVSFIEFTNNCPESSMGFEKRGSDLRMAYKYERLSMACGGQDKKKWQEQLTIISSFETRENCRGIASSNEKIFVACGGLEKEGPGHVRMFDMEGQLLKTIMNKAILSFPYKLKFSNCGSVALITDGHNLVQLVVTKEDKIDMKKLDIAMDSRTNYASVCFDANGRALISDSYARSIKLLSHDLAHFEPVVTGLEQFPLATYFDQSSLKLYVGFLESKDLLCFNLVNNNWEKPSKFSLMV